MVFPSSRPLRRYQMDCETLLETSRVLQSPKQTLTPPGCRLRACACQLGQLFGKLSFEQPIRLGPRPGRLTEVVCTPSFTRMSLQFSMSSEYSLLSLGTVQSPIDEAAV